MITFNADGTTDIDFPTGVVRVRPPTFGGLKRLRSERVRLAREAQDAIAAWETEHPAPEGDDMDPQEATRRSDDRIVETERLNLASTEAWWRLVLVGDDSFKRLTDDPVPENVDDWPAHLLYDIRPVIPPGSSVDVILSAQSTPDRLVRHWGEGRSRSGSTAGAGQATNH